MLDNTGKDPEEIVQPSLPSNLGSQHELRATQRATALLLVFAVLVVLAVVCGFVAAVSTLVDGKLALVWKGVSLAILGLATMIILFPPRKR